VQIRLFADANPILDEPVAYDDHVEPDGVERPVRLHSAFTGLHRLEVLPPSNSAMVEVPDTHVPLTFPASLDHHNRLVSRWSLYFYVPRGTTVIGGYTASGRLGHIRDSAGESHCDFSKLPQEAYFSVVVPEGQDGKLWKFDGCFGNKFLLTVPPWVACNAESLLLPREVLERDSQVDHKR